MKGFHEYNCFPGGMSDKSLANYGRQFRSNIKSACREGELLYVMAEHCVRGGLEKEIRTSNVLYGVVASYLMNCNGAIMTYLSGKNRVGPITRSKLYDLLAVTRRSMMLDIRWIKRGRPYYNVWPKLIDKFGGLALSGVPAASLKTTSEPLLLRMPVGCKETRFKMGDDQIEIGTILFGDVVSGPIGGNSEMALLSANVDLPIQGGEGDNRYASRTVEASWRTGDDNTIQEVLQNRTKKLQGGEMRLSSIDEDRSIESFILRMVAIASMIDEDSDFLTPDEPDYSDLTDAQRRMAKSDEKMAKKLGVSKEDVANGMNLGRDFEVSPHWRRAHIWLMPYGPRRSLRKLAWRKGAIVKRKVMETVPTGYESEERKDTKCE